MKMPSRFSIGLVALALTVASSASAASIADIAKAEAILQKIVKIAAKYRTQAIELPAPQPLADKSGKYFLPYTADGQMTAWAAKAVAAEVGAIVGEQAGAATGKAVASKIPFGGLVSGATKKKGKELGAIAAVGGAEFIKESSELSFNSLEDYAVYLQATRASDSNYTQALAAAMAIYPDLESTFDNAIAQAYKLAAKAVPKTT